MLALLALLTIPAHAALPSTVRAAVSTGDCATVLALTQDLDGDAAHLVRGRCQLITGDAAGAAETLAGVTEGVYGAVASLSLAEAHLSLNRPADAFAALVDQSLPGDAGLRMRLTRGQALISQRRSLEARPDLRRLLSTNVGDEARFFLAIGGRDRGDTEAAISTFRRVWADSTRGPWSDRAATELANLGKPVPSLATTEDRLLLVDRIAALDKAHQYEESLRLRMALHHVEPMGPLTLARANFKARQYPIAVKNYRKALGAANQATGAPGDLFQYALGTVRTGDYATAAVIYRRLIVLHGSNSKADTASYKLGYLHADRAEWDQANAALLAHISAYPNSAHLDEAYWWMGWGAFVQGKHADAKKYWSSLVSSRPRSSLVPGAAYWTARVAGLQGNAAAERTGLESVLRRYPTSGYAWFAAEKLQAKNAPQPDAVPPDFPEALAEREEIRRARALLDVGLEDLAREELRPLISTAKAAGKDASLAMAWTLIDAGAYREGKALAKPYCTSPWKGGDPVAQQACYPRPAAQVVSATAKRFSVPALVPYGIMTTESALDPSVVSIAGARGLMQLMPKEAGEIHKTLYGDRPFHPDMLFSAPYNASLGVAELGTKQRLLGDVLEGPDIVAAIAAYNGGETAVKRWTDGLGGHPEFDVFAEQIGYTETRRYVKKVLGTVMAYRYVYGDE